LIYFDNLQTTLIAACPRLSYRLLELLVANYKSYKRNA
jgi:hypothetical protein